MFTHILCSLEKDTALKNKEIKYIRVLSFNKVGQKILNSVKKKIDIPIITTVKYYKDLLDYDIKIEKIYKAITKWMWLLYLIIYLLSFSLSCFLL